MTGLPRIVVAGTRSGVGKTSVATGLMAALRLRGLRVSNHKVGPDFIDPGYHAVATGRAPRNLDPFLHGEHRVAGLLLHGAGGADGPADLAVVEGVMGLFDGRGSTGEASTAHVARLLDAPVLLVVDAAGTSRSVAAEIHGFATFDPSVRVAGVILNRVASAAHERVVREVIAPLGVPVVGVVHRREDLTTPARHLGLVPAAERAADARRTVAALADVIVRQVDLDAVVRIARTAQPLSARPWDPAAEVAAGPDGPAAVSRGSRVALAGGRAFTFTYTEHAELLASAGVEVAVFDPLRDESLPDGAGAVVLGGGFPETYAHELSANGGLRRSLAAFAAAGGPVIAECGGLVYLCRTLDGVPMCGVLDLDARFTPRLRLGYRRATVAADGPLGPAGTRVRAHEFHRTEVGSIAGSPAAWTVGPEPTGADPGVDLEGDIPEGFRVGNVVASYLHPSWVGTPSVARAVATAAGRRTREEVHR